jgi:ATP-dependent helicase STH1/SNF2
MPIPDHIQQAIRPHNSAIPDLEKVLQPPDVPSRIVDAAVKVAKQESVTPAPAAVPSSGEPKVEEAEPVDPSTLPKGPFLEDNVDSGIYPYNAYRHPFSHLKRSPDADPKLSATRLQRLLIPTIMPAGLDAHQILNERERFIEARIQQRISELESLPATIGDGDFETNLDLTLGEGTKEEKEDKENDNTAAEPSLDIIKTENTFRSLIHPPPGAHGKLRALIELKSLRVLEKQRAMRAQVAERLTHGSMLPLNRLEFRRAPRKPTLRDARMIEQLERKQRVDRERRAKHKHVEQLGIIVTHGREVINANRGAQDRLMRLSRAVLNFHAQTEKEEQKRIERLAKERLKALKNDDEEAYMKLIDTAKDTRITHLLRQTDAYLDSLAQAVVAQQNEYGPLAVHQNDPDEGPTSEATFGAQVSKDDEETDRKIDYYAIAHRVSERISKQPNMLVGGTLKEYQLKGLQWMVSLYNNRLNGILADEMVSGAPFAS